MKTQLSLADAQVIQRVLNLTRHPLFEAPHKDELPAWHEAIADLSKLLQTVEVEGVAWPVAQITQLTQKVHKTWCVKMINQNCNCSCGVE